MPRLRRLALWGGLAIGTLGAFAVTTLVFPNTALAQELNFNLGEGGSMTGSLLRMIALLTILSLAPGILVVVTSFTRIVVVFSLLRSAIGLQQTPPNTVIISLSLFLTAFIMMPTLQQSYEEGIAPLIAEEISEDEAFDRTVGPLRIFMLR
ncbi:MAG: flagellar biosynthetic protein FliP, partial [Rhodospirillaceae bacterium]|nr:flagellar biosynthetic protein FliP [Rhodospirillaceae bacterium]